MTNTEQEMTDRWNQGLDPLTSKPWVLCGTSVTQTFTERGAVCDGCGHTVTLDADGGYVYK